MDKPGKKSLLSFCKNVELASASYISPFSRVYESSLGFHTSVGWFCQIQNCRIGEGVAIASHCSLGAINHLYNLPVLRFSPRSFGRPSPTTIIGSDVWIGSHCTIMAGVTIGTGAIIACNSFVNTDVGDYEVYGGTPAKFIKKRFSNDITERLLQIQPWTKDDNYLIEVLSRDLSMDEYLKILESDNEK
ncbi:conserved hypothetical protein [Vibrio chagasii]|nr:conserved hypothetical protein [Vibrio chagasii]CAH7155917.1 conserved hypothetical protein [Vibrio chagasii]CAH7210250.1 conserved hypothetical protein [Vibrio chagasii]